MSEKNVKRVRKIIKKQKRNIILQFISIAKKYSLKDRIRFAIIIIFKRRVEL
jgi:hypothetical protein